MVLFPAAKKGTLVRMRHQRVRTQNSFHLLRMLLEFYCGRGGQPCPDRYTCLIHPADRYAVCCPDAGMGRK